MTPFVSRLLSLVFSGMTVCARAQPAPLAPASPSTAGAATAPAVATLTPRQVDHLAALGQVWGFLKYFHPAVAAGQRDWDAEFLRQVPAVLACRSVAARSRLLSAWVTGLGPVPACPACAAPPTKPVRLAPDLRWAHDAKRFGAALREQLAFVAANRYQGPPYYVTQVGATTLFPHEEAYAASPLPPPGLRLLGLCRYWNMLQYYYPYPYALEGEWARVLPELLPRFAAAATPLAYRHAALALFARVHDGHARFYPPDALLEAERGAYQVAAEVQFLEDHAVVVRVRRDGLVPPCPLEPGDVLTHLAGTAVTDLVKQRLPETGASNRAAQLNTIALNLLYCATPQVDVQVVRAGRSLHVVSPAAPVGSVPPVQPAVADSMYRFLTPEIGYIDMARIQGAKVATLMRAFAHTKGIVVDQRNYPGEFVATYLPGFLLAQPVAYAKFTQRDPTYPGRFLWYPADTLKPVGATPYTGRVVVLVNEKSRSQAEFTAMAFQATPHGTLLGSQTAGADGNTTPITLPGGLKTLMTGIGAYYPDGRETQRVGLRIDVPVRPTIAGLREGRDELRDRAVELIIRAPARTK
ncbi:S41 family peptidase [Hymenobacter arizonensis]|uniref:C-terminal processing protease CtpA/Prc, contains a PDZ domain n=1 Tax=Hymenobacter arizonensis TaxID=1227077 RepID=A0A1I6A090_HYMAR|nr:S41 family peptidase [Hymenobacter arizonensis]SFQ62116.1 C-terminal processing protease CtpA/Prc, contains a PDZ domain [Hymenobacter arizonensis]